MKRIAALCVALALGSVCAIAVDRAAEANKGKMPPLVDVWAHVMYQNG